MNLLLFLASVVYTYVLTAVCTGMYCTRQKKAVHIVRVMFEFYFVSR